MFKVGDWVQTDEGIFRVRELKYSKEGTEVHIYDHNEFYFWFYDEECKLWQPKEGEWCWFYDSEYPLSYILCKFETFDNGFWCRPNFSDTMERFNGCEPFIGELPSFLKEQ